VAAPGTKRTVGRAVKAVVGAAVLAAVGWHVWKTLLDLRSRGGPPKLSATWVAASIAAYWLGLGVYALYYVRVMARSATPIRRYAGSRAYVVSHLGKYVPGKALVVVMRVGMSIPAGARPATAAFATVYETLVMMAVGGFVAFGCLTFGGSGATMLDLPRIGPLGPSRLPLGVVGLAMGLAFLVLVLPPVFPRLSALARMPFPDIGPDALPRVSYRLLSEGIVATLAGWVLLGLSQAAILRAMMPSGLPPSLWLATIGSVALATVAGFAVPVSPGGLGVREWVLWTSLGTVIDRDLAVLASLGLRLAWVAAEVVAGVILLMVKPRPQDLPRAATP
jgi:glycosyltransferase 2 family protein